MSIDCQVAMYLLQCMYLYCNMYYLYCKAVCIVLLLLLLNYLDPIMMVMIDGDEKLIDFYDSFDSMSVCSTLILIPLTRIRLYV